MRVVHGRGLLARALIRVLRLPRASEDADMRLDIVVHQGGESWRRTFDGVPVTTWQQRPQPDLLVERFGRLEFRFRLVSRNGELRYQQITVSVRLATLLLPVPSALAPTVEGRERARDDERIEVHVRVTWPPAGLILQYDGDVQIEDHG